VVQRSIYLLQRFSYNSHPPYLTANDSGGSSSNILGSFSRCSLNLVFLSAKNVLSKKSSSMTFPRPLAAKTQCRQYVRVGNMSSSVQIIGSPNVFSLHFTHSQFSSPSSTFVQYFLVYISSLPRTQHTLKLSPTTSFVLMSLVSTPVKLNSASLTAKAGYSFRGISNRHPMNECSFASSTLSDAISLVSAFAMFRSKNIGEVCANTLRYPCTLTTRKSRKLGAVKSAEFRESREPKPTTATKAPSLVMALGGGWRDVIFGIRREEEGGAILWAFLCKLFSFFWMPNVPNLSSVPPSSFTSSTTSALLSLRK
jgi:hypothetical protein